MIVGSNIFYHLCAKSMPEAVNPLASLAITYIVSAISTVILYFLTSPVKNLATEYGSLNWTSFILGLAIVGLEFGYISMYKVGWNISTGPLVANITLAVILIIVGIVIFKETITIEKVIGMALCLGGLILINK